MTRLYRTSVALFVVPLVPWAVAQDELGSCGECFCIPSAGETCPSDLEPNMNFTSTQLSNLLEFELQNPVSLNCNPYDVTTFSDNTSSSSIACDLEPTPLQEGGACVIDLISPEDDSACPNNWKYSLRTFAGTLEEAQSQDLYVTHAGACGACSSLQDLYVYLFKGEQVREGATLCGIRGFGSTEDGIQCFQELGFSRSCAAAWQYNTVTTREFCIDQCADFYLNSKSPNGPPPECALDPCIECDEIIAGPIFKRFAGRTRRSSGLLSSIARNCSELVPIPQTDPCEAVVSPVPTESPVSSGNRLGWRLIGGVSLSQQVFAIFGFLALIAV